MPVATTGTASEVNADQRAVTPPPAVRADHSTRPGGGRPRRTEELEPRNFGRSSSERLGWHEDWPGAKKTPSRQAATGRRGRGPPCGDDGDTERRCLEFASDEKPASGHCP